MVQTPNVKVQILRNWKLTWEPPVSIYSRIKSVSILKPTAREMWSSKNQKLFGPRSTLNSQICLTVNSRDKLLSIRSTTSKLVRKMSTTSGDYNWSNQKSQPGISTHTDTKFTAFKSIWVTTWSFTADLLSTFFNSWVRSVVLLNSSLSLVWWA